jgi:hypothetical protein
MGISATAVGFMGVCRSNSGAEGISHVPGRSLSAIMMVVGASACQIIDVALSKERCRYP